MQTTTKDIQSIDTKKMCWFRDGNLATHQRLVIMRHHGNLDIFHVQICGEHDESLGKEPPTLDMVLDGE